MSENKTTRFLFGELTAICITLISLFIFAAIVQFLSPNATTVKIVNQAIKTVALFIGCFIFIKKQHGLAGGALFGLVYAVLCFLGFGAATKSLLFDWSALIEILYGLVVGGISGVISVNARR